MKIPWNLILIEDLQETLNMRLRVIQRPFFWFIIWVSPPLNVLMWLSRVNLKGYLESDRMIQDLCMSGISILMMIAAVIGLKRPKWLTTGVLVARSFTTILVCYMQDSMFSGKDTGKDPVEYIRLVFNFRDFIFLLYM